MANLNKVHLIGRLTRDPEVKTFSTGGKITSFGFAVNNRKKNQSTGQWEDEPCYVDVKAFDRENGRKLATSCEQYLKRGDQAYLECHLVQESWEDKQTQQKRSKLVMVLDDVQFLQVKRDGQGIAPERSQQQGGQAPAQREPAHDPAPYMPDYGGADDIPF